MSCYMNCIYITHLYPNTTYIKGLNIYVVVYWFINYFKRIYGLSSITPNHSKFLWIIRFIKSDCKIKTLQIPSFRYFSSYSTTLFFFVDIRGNNFSNEDNMVSRINFLEKLTFVVNCSIFYQR